MGFEFAPYVPNRGTRSIDSETAVELSKIAVGTVLYSAENSGVEYCNSTFYRPSYSFMYSFYSFHTPYRPQSPPSHTVRVVFAGPRSTPRWSFAKLSLKIARFAGRVIQTRVLRTEYTDYLSPNPEDAQDSSRSC